MVYTAPAFQVTIGVAAFVAIAFTIVKLKSRISQRSILLWLAGSTHVAITATAWALAGDIAAATYGVCTALWHVVLLARLWRNHRQTRAQSAYFGAAEALDALSERVKARITANVEH